MTNEKSYKILLTKLSTMSVANVKTWDNSCTGWPLLL